MTVDIDLARDVFPISDFTTGHFYGRRAEEPRINRNSRIFPKQMNYVVQFNESNPCFSADPRF